MYVWIMIGQDELDVNSDYIFTPSKRSLETANPPTNQVVHIAF